MTTSISFGAQPLKEVKVKKYFFSVPANIVEIDTNSRSDFDAIDRAVNSWNFDSYGVRIRDFIKYQHENNKNLKKIRFLALTTQKDEFSNLNSSKILGLIQISENKFLNVIDYLQVKPSSKHNSLLRKYRGVGSAIMEYIKTQYDKISLFSAPSAVKFYEKKGFVRAGSENSMLIWEKK